MQQSLSLMNAAGRQASTGLRLQAASDDPVATNQVMQSSSTLRALAQYKKNVQAGTARSQAEETVLNSLTTILSRARSLAVSQGTATATPATMAQTRAEVEQLLAEARSLGNTQFENGYLFGGLDSQTAPFPLGAPPFSADSSPSGQQQTEIGSGQYRPSAHNGTQVFLDTGVLQSLYDLDRALANDDAGAVKQSIGGLTDAFSGVQTLLGDVGAWQNSFQIASSNIDALTVNLTAFKSSLSDADMESAITDLLSRQNTYQAAMAATARVMNLSFTDYLR